MSGQNQQTVIIQRKPLVERNRADRIAHVSWPTAASQVPTKLETVKDTLKIISKELSICSEEFWVIISEMKINLKFFYAGIPAMKLHENLDPTFR